MRSINCKFNYNQKSRSEITPRKIFIGVLKYILYQCLLQYVHSVALSGFFSEVFLYQSGVSFFSTILILLLGVLVVQ